ncbi:hypothetical protein A9B99_14540 [Mangrovibacter phragmitis]|uniref:Uncharacterized protein n=1 Tax=Mangrovibacter phragmitis TaxID=1691903 RepID=A0A1B7KZP3_9ENTR|nr:hypothetical protein A9B99_14540 [Mangrovibacter phragmitis]
MAGWVCRVCAAVKTLSAYKLDHRIKNSLFWRITYVAKGSKKPGWPRKMRTIVTNIDVVRHNI